MISTATLMEVPGKAVLPSTPKASGRLVLRCAPRVMTWARPRDSIIVPRVMMIEGTFSQAMKKALIPPTHRAPARARASATP